jgi:hypothetical protein
MDSHPANLLDGETRNPLFQQPPKKLFIPKCKLKIPKYFFIFFGGTSVLATLLCLCRPLFFFFGVWIWTQSRAAVASRRATNLPTHLPNLATHFPKYFMVPGVQILTEFFFCLSTPFPAQELRVGKDIKDTSYERSDKRCCFLDD